MYKSVYTYIRGTLEMEFVLILIWVMTGFKGKKGNIR